MTRPRQLRQEGMVMVFTLLILALAVVILAPTVSQAFFRSQASRAAVARTIAQADATGAALSMSRIIAGPLREVVRNEAESNAAFGTAYYFGEGTTSSVTSDLQALASRIQTQADAIFCSYTPPSTSASVSLKVYFTGTACGEPLPSDLSLPNPRMTQGRADGFQEYSLPFIATSSTTAGEFVGERVFQGEFRIGLGSDSFARYALWVNNNFSPDGTPGYLRSWNVFEGPVHVNGIANVWGAPYITGTMTSASCPALDPAGGCAQDPTPALGLYTEGIVPAGSLTPSPDAPCYPGGDCPTFAGGADYSARLLPLPDDLTNPVLASAASGGIVLGEPVDELLLSTGSSPLNPGRQTQNIRARGTTRTWRFFAEDGTPQLWLETPAGENLVLNYDFASGTTNGWIYPTDLAAVPRTNTSVPPGAPTPFVARLTSRDAYYGPAFPVQTGDSFRVAIEAASGTATGITGTGTYQLQIGLRFQLSDGSNLWIGASDAGGSTVPNDGTWHTASGTITAPVDAVSAQVWVQIDQPAGDAYSYYFTNVSVNPVAHTEYSIVAPTFNGVVYAIHNIDNLHGPAAGAAVHRNRVLSIGAEGNVRITDNLYLEEPPCSQGPGFTGGNVVPSVCENLSAANVLGIYSHDGNILIADSAPDTVHVSAALMARNGWVGAEAYDTRDAAGSVFVLGSIVEDRYGQFGRNDSSGTLINGYNLTLVYDPRFAPNTALYPPGWPTHEEGLLYVVLTSLTELR